MAIFNIQNQKLLPINEKAVDLEKDIQKLTEENLEIVFGLKFIGTEFALQNFRIDTLAFDNETKSFVIIEYKRDKNLSVIDQGYAYLALMLNNKADFILEYNEKMKEYLKREDVDWSQSRVLFLANSFTTYQQNAINFRDLPIELWEVKKYDNGTMLYNQLKAMESKESVKTISKNKIIENVSREVKKYSIEDHFKKGWENSRDLFEDIREKIFSFDNRITEGATQAYIGYYVGPRKILCTFHIYKSKLELQLGRVDKGDLRDPERKIVKVPWRERGWGKTCAYEIKNRDDIDYALFLIKQVYEKFYK